MTEHSPEAIAAYPDTYMTRDDLTHLRTALDKGRESKANENADLIADMMARLDLLNAERERKLTTTREALIDALKPGLERFGSIYARVNPGIVGGIMADTILAPDGPLRDEREVLIAYEERRKPAVVIENIEGQPASEWMAAHDRTVVDKALETLLQRLGHNGFTSGGARFVVAKYRDEIREGS